MSGFKKEVRELMDLATSYGFEFSRYTGSGHIMMKAPNGSSVTLAVTPSHPRTYKNAKSLINRLGKEYQQEVSDVRNQPIEPVQ